MPKIVIRHRQVQAHISVELFRIRVCTYFLRSTGENISAWEIERIIERLDFVEQTAVIGVPDEIGDEGIKLLVKLSKQADENDPTKVVAEWCLTPLPTFQMPRYLESH